MALEFGLPYTIINARAGTAWISTQTTISAFIIMFLMGRATSNDTVWILEDAGDGFVRIKNLNGLGKYFCLEGDISNGTRAICSAHQQTWRIFPESGDPSRFRIAFSSTNSVIDLDNGNPTPGTRVQIWGNDSPNEVWFFVPKV
ncbi:carbohydrate-binding module family 13 protein [Hydnum rufescens UP504]|uniref:Carbohydrate-binding module family 13 protein n=1 Tax=Hydnum rufescens UP504 TaxID=1448309 RepID=A0A9P6DVA2_9AGAM|nr:carbohydrate-binding module family 13 protein [Hydnum rufescens UP504]